MSKKKTAKKKVARKVAAKKMGRPTAYRVEYCEQAKMLSRKGFIDREMAEFFGVSARTFDGWKLKHPDFMRSLKEGKADADTLVEEALFKKATGFTTIETKFATAGGEITDVKTYEKHHLPDTAAAIFWLKNRKREEWREKIDHEHAFTGDVEVTIGGNAEDDE